VDDHVGPVGILWVVQKTTNVVNKQWVEQVRNFLFVGEIEGSFVRNPELISLLSENEE
jgi:hypothetical protein